MFGPGSSLFGEVTYLETRLEERAGWRSRAIIRQPAVFNNWHLIDIFCLHRSRTLRTGSEGEAHLILSSGRMAAWIDVFGIRRAESLGSMKCH